MILADRNEFLLLFMYVKIEYLKMYIFLLHPDRRVEYCDECVCLCVCACLSVHVTFGPGSIFLWQRSDTLCTSGFMDDVIFAHKPRLLNVAAQLKRSAHAALGLAVNCVL